MKLNTGGWKRVHVIVSVLLLLVVVQSYSTVFSFVFHRCSDSLWMLDVFASLQEELPPPTSQTAAVGGVR